MASSPSIRRAAVHAVASALRALRRLPAAGTGVRLAGAARRAPAAPVRLVLLHHLSALLLDQSVEVVRHG